MRVTVPRTAVALIALAAVGVLQAAEIVVDTTTTYSIAGDSRIPKGIFGGTAFCNTGEFATADCAGGSVLAKELRLGMVRLVANMAWWLPNERPRRVPADLTTLFNMGVYNRRGPYWNTLPFPIGHVLRNFKANLAAAPLLIIGDNTGPAWLVKDKIPVDAKEYAEVLAAFVRLARKDDPGLKYVQLVNEPNAYWFKHYRNPVAAWIDYFLTVARRLHREFPDLRVGGPVLCWPPHYPPTQKGMPNWYTWESWSKPVIDVTGRELGFFDYHYGTTPEDTTFSLQIVTAEAMRAHVYRLKSVVSEANPNWRLSGESLKVLSKLLEARTLAWERYLFTLLRERDKVLGSLWHDLGGGGGMALRGTAHWGEYWVLWIFRNLRGTALWSASPDASLPVAASVEKGRVTVLVWNDSAKPRAAALKLTLPPGARPAVTAERLEWDLAANHGKGKVIHGPMPPDALRVESREGAVHLTWQATPWGMYAIYATRLEGFRTRRVVRQQELFGDVVMGALSPASPTAEVTVAVDPKALAAAQKVALRIGLLDVARDGQVTVRASRWKASLPRPQAGTAAIQQVIVNGKLKSAASAPSTQTGNYELAAPFITPGRNRMRLSADFREGDQPVRIGYVTVITVGRPVEQNGSRPQPTTRGSK